MTGSCCGSDAQCACNALRGVLPGGLYRTVSDVFCVCQIISRCGCGVWHDCFMGEGSGEAGGLRELFICDPVVTRYVCSESWRRSGKCTQHARDAPSWLWRGYRANSHKRRCRGTRETAGRRELTNSRVSARFSYFYFFLPRRRLRVCVARPARGTVHRAPRVQVLAGRSRPA